jgi:hypothetical protein
MPIFHGKVDFRKERAPLVLSFHELHELENDEKAYMSSNETYFGKFGLIRFVSEEVNALLQTLFLKDGIECVCCKYLRSYYNPIYSTLYIFLYALTFPGAAVHWLLFDQVSIRTEYDKDDERDMRSQGIYMMISLSLVCIPLDVLGIMKGTDNMKHVDAFALIVNLVMIMISLLGLKAIGDKLIITMRLYIIVTWLFLVLQIVLAFVDVYSYVLFAWETLINYALRILNISILTVIAVNSIDFWRMFDNETVQFEEYMAKKDRRYASMLGLLVALVLMTYAIMICTNERHAWRLAYW